MPEMLLTKAAPDVEHEHFEPPDEDLALIQRYARRDVKAEDVYTGAMHAANTKVDRVGERFTKAYLERFAETLPGKPTLEGHDTTKKPNGRIYKAEVLPDGDGWFLKTYYYVRSDSPLVTDIELGIAKDVSIGYRAHRRVCDLDGKEWHPYRSGKDYCEHEPLEEYGGQTCTLTYCDTAVHKAEGMEMSWVWVGAQHGAEAIAKSFDGREVAFLKDLYRRLHGTSEPGRGDPPMTVEEVQAKLVAAEETHQKAAGDWQKQMQELKLKAQEGDAYRGWLTSEILRMAGSLGKTQTYTALMARMADATVEQLLPVYTEVGEEFDAKFSKGRGQVDTDPGDPNEVRKSDTGGMFRRRRLVGGAR